LVFLTAWSWIPKKDYTDQGVPDQEFFDQNFPDQNFPDQEPSLEPRRTPKIQIVVSCICGIVFATAIAGLLIDHWPKDHWPKAVQLSRFIALIALLAPTIAIIGHWVFVTHPNQIAEKLAKEKEARNPAIADDIADETDPELDDDLS
jgi:hypothetical protein